MGTFGFIDTSYDDQLSTCSDADQPLFPQITNSSSELSFAFQKLSKQQLSSAIPATRFQLVKTKTRYFGKNICDFLIDVFMKINNIIMS